MSFHKCTRCKQVFGSYQALNAHKGQKHDTHVTLECRVCGDSFTTVESESESRVTCSKSCMAKDQSDRFSGSGNPNYNHDVNTDELINLYEEGLSAQQVGKNVGMSTMQVLERLKFEGVEIRDDTFGTNQKTSFGLEVKSGLEAVTAEWLDRYGPEEWEYEPKGFPGPYIPDFVLGDGTVLEVWGLDSESYDGKRTQKQEWYSQNGHTLISVEKDDVRDMKQMIEV